MAEFYQERSRIRIIEWLRNNNFHFVFEEDLELPRLLIEKLKKQLFETKVGKDIQNARKTLLAKAKTYYSNEALNPRPKRGRPPKQTPSWRSNRKSAPTFLLQCRMRCAHSSLRQIMQPLLLRPSLQNLRRKKICLPPAARSIQLRQTLVWKV